MNSKPTQGPWAARPDPSSNAGDHPMGDYMIGVGDEIDCVAVCSPRSNADLIAAAPDLLEVVRLCEGICNPDGALIQQVRTAILKATGAA